MPSSANSSGGFRLRRSPTVGANAVAQWLRENGLDQDLLGWTASIAFTVAVQHALDTPEPTRLELALEPEQWRLRFSHGGRTSRIRVSELAAVDGCDDHDLLVITPPLRDLGQLLRQLERRHALRFHRETADVRTEHPSIEDAARRWLARL